MAGRESTIALLTDFGTRDPYVAAIKGVIAARSSARIIDLSHEIAAYDVVEAAFFLDFVLRDFPRCGQGGVTVVMTVVDPGVGSGRRVICTEAGGRILLAPDNGVLSLVLDQAGAIRAVENRELFLPEVSRTFHGRDLFAPVAAALANGGAVSTVGPPIDRQSLQRLDYVAPDYDDAVVAGRIIAIDRFGNCVTDLEAGKLGREAALRVGGQVVNVRASCYDEAPEGVPFAIRGSRGTLEISFKKQSAADKLQLARFDPVVVESR